MKKTAFVPSLIALLRNQRNTNEMVHGNAHQCKVIKIK